MNLASGLRRFVLTSSIAASVLAPPAWGQQVCWLHFDGNATGSSSIISVNLDGTVIRNVAIPNGTTDDAARDLVLTEIRRSCTDPFYTTVFDAEPVGHTSLYVTSHDGGSFFTCEVTSTDPTLSVSDVLVTPPAMGIDLDFGATAGGTVPDDVGPTAPGTIRVTPNHGSVTAPYTAGESDSDIAHALFVNLVAAGFDCWWSDASIVILHDPNSQAIDFGLVDQLPAPDPNIVADWTFPIYFGALTPASACCQSGATIRIAGKGFLGTPQVLFNGVATDPLSVTVTDTEISCTAPNGSCAGALVDVTVHSPASFQHATRCKAFSYTDCTRIDSVTPGIGPSAGGTSVTILGRRFLPGTPVVKFGTVAVMPSLILVQDDQTILCPTPGGAAGVVSVTVMNANGTAVRPNAFTYQAPPPPPTPAPIASPEMLALLAVAMVALGAWFLRRRP